MFREDIAHIKDGDTIFQVLNEEGDDWDENATREQYQNFLKSKTQ